MILRRFMQHIKEQNWFAVGLDVLVVIVGIFLGMQVTEWNENLKSKKQEKLLLERILHDLAYSKSEFTRFKDNVERRYSDAETALRALQNPTLPFPKNAGIAFARSIQISPQKPQIISIHEAVSSGQMKLIRSQEIRAEIAELESELDSRWQLRNNLVPYVTALIPEIQSKIRRTFDANGEMITSVDFDTLSKDESFQNSVGYAIISLKFNARWFGSNIKDIEGLEVIIKNELERLK